MANEERKNKYNGKGMAMRGGGAGGVWFLGFVGALVYYLHFHSGSFWLVVLAIIKAMFWPAYLVYYLLQSMSV
ncbi:MAG TPA: hypothetical protein VLH86_04130 [Patescibacteria group bacterium]|nr:hypothetical protein [Patescibacteria group bacterium]